MPAYQAAIFKETNPVSSAKDLLSQEELDFLLSPADSGEHDGEQPAASGLDDDDFLNAGQPEKDDTREGLQKNDTGSRAGKSSLQESVLTERVFATLFERELTKNTDAYITLEYKDVRHMAYGEFQASLEEPACFVLLDAKPAPGRMLFCAPPDITQALSDVSLGSYPPCQKKRCPTALDIMLVQRLVRSLPDCVARAWNLPYCDLRRHTVHKNDIFLTEAQNSVRIASYIMNIENIRNIFYLAWED